MGSPAPRCALGRGGHFTLAADVFLPCAGLFDCPQPGFLTRRIEYFRTTAPSLANTRKTETPHFQTHPSDAPPQGRPKRGKMTLYGTNRPQKSTRKWPWIENSMGWIGRSMGWKQKSMGWMAPGAPPRRLSNAKTQTTVGVRFNGLPYSAQGRAACTLPPARRGKSYLRRDAILASVTARTAHSGGGMPGAELRLDRGWTPGWRPSPPGRPCAGEECRGAAAP